MKHLSKNRLMVSRTAGLFFASLIVLTGLLSGLINTLPGGLKASALGNDTKACQAIIAAKHQPPITGDKVNDIPTKGPLFDSCKTGYNLGYQSPDNNSTPSQCSSQNLTYCQDGYKKGQADKKAASGQTTPSPAAAKAKAEKICKPYKDQSGISSDDKKDNFNGCVAGYVGQAEGKDSTEACKKYTAHALSACLNGHKASETKSAGITPGSPEVKKSPSGNAEDSADNSKLNCGVSNPLNFILCPFVDLLTSVINSLDTVISDQLAIGTNGNGNSPDAIFCTDKPDCQAYHKAWAQFRNIALGLMTLAGLIILISQALGIELLDAYTIRKTLPRLLIAALGITLSWELMQFFITLTNELGYAVRGLIYSPFTSLGKNEFDLSFGGLGVTGLLGGIGYLAVGALGLFLLACSGALAVFVAILVLVLRQIAVIMMLILAPIAIVAYVLPNTQRVYKFWWESFSKALLMFPLIEAFIAAGRVFSVLSFNTSNNAGDFNQIIGFMAYFAPYFLIPATFKLAGGAIRQIGGFVNDRSRGGFDMLRKKRQDNTSKRVQAAQKGGIYRNDLGQFRLRPGGKQRSLGRGLNTFGNYTLDVGDSGRELLGRKQILGRSNPVGRFFLGRTSDILNQKINRDTVAHSRKAAQDLGLHYATGRALSGQLQYFTKRTPDGKGLTDDAITDLNNTFGIKDEKGNLRRDENNNIMYRSLEGRNDALQMSQILSRSNDDSDSSGALQAAQELNANAGLLGALKGAGNDETQRADLRTIGLLTAAQAGRLENHEIAAEHNKWMEDKPEGYATAATNVIQDVATQKRPSQSRGQGLAFDSDGKAYDVYQDPTSSDAQKSLMRLATQEVGAAKSEDLDNTANAWIYGISEYDMNYDDKTKKLVVKRDKEGNKVRKTDKVKAAQAEQLRERIKTMSLYNYGDSDVGRKLADIYGAAGFDPRELGRGSGADMDPASLPAAEQAPEDKPAQQP